MSDRGFRFNAREGLGWFVTTIAELFDLGVGTVVSMPVRAWVGL